MLTVNLLGTPEVEVNQNPIKVDTRKAIALIAYLVVEKSATRDTLASLLWADSSQDKARAALRRTLSALRRATGGDYISADRNMVSLVGDITSDHEIMSSELAATTDHDHSETDVCGLCVPHLRRATGLYRGDFLQGFSIRSSPDFEDWTRNIAESTRRRAGEAFNRLGAALASQGEYPAAIAAVNHWISLDPLHEPAHRFVMLLHAWAGDRPGAIESYRRCVAVLDQELGVAPLEETTELYEAILDEDLPPPPGARRRVQAETTPDSPGRADLIDRDVELRILHDHMHSATTNGRVIAVTGAPWMGKTRLLEELASDARSQGRTVLIGRAFRMERTLPFGVAAQVLRAALPQINSFRAEIPEWALTETGRLLPDVGSQSPEGVPDAFGEIRLLEGINVVLSAVAGHGALVIILDDVQWIDTPSADVFSYLARRLSTVPILLVAAARSDDELTSEMTELLGEADASLVIEPLGLGELTALTGDPARAGELLQETGGVPLLVSAAAASGPTGGVDSPEVFRYMESRLREVGSLGRQILTTASVLNGLCDAYLLRVTSGRSEEEVVDAVEELVSAGLLREMPESDHLAFTLDSLEKAVYDSTSLVRRRLLHGRAASALAELGHARNDARLAAAVAAQYRAAGRPEAAGWYQRSGELARAIYANDAARDFYKSSLATGDADAASVHLALGELAMIAGDYGEALQELTVAASHADEGSIGVIEHRIGEVERLLGRFKAAEEHFGRSLENHPEPAILLADWALLNHRTGDSSKANSLASDARDAAEVVGDPRQLSKVYNILAVVASAPEEALSHADEAIRLADTDDMLRMAALNNKALIVSSTGDAEKAMELIQEAIEIAERTGHRHRQAALWNHLADLHHRTGREGDSREALTKAVALFADIDSGEPEPELWFLSQW
jgi:DNA-binding SARP family transcriptional activator/Tfp pilus assembly protein PilF